MLLYCGRIIYEEENIMTIYEFQNLIVDDRSQRVKIFDLAHDDVTEVFDGHIQILQDKPLHLLCLLYHEQK